MTPPDDLAAAVLAEIEGLHRFFAAWFLGTCPDDAPTFARCAAALDAEFVQIGPTGRERSRTALLDALKEAHGCYAGLTFAIRIERPRVRLIRPDLALATYEEWQEHGARSAGRRSSALLAAAPAAPGGVAWLHLQETWIVQ